MLKAFNAFVTVTAKFASSPSAAASSSKVSNKPGAPFTNAVISEVSATVPVESGNVIVLSAVGFVTVRVVSNALSVAPSTIMDAPGTRRFLLASSPATPDTAPISVSST